VSIPADASVKGLFGPVKPWPLIAVHGVLTSDGRVLSYGTKEDGKQTGYFVYDVWDPLDDSHMVLANTTQTDLFCSSQIQLPDGESVAISGGDTWTGTATTNTGNNKDNVFTVATQSLTRGSTMNRKRWYSSSTMLLNGEIYVQGGSGGTDFPEIRGADGIYRLLTGAATGGSPGLTLDYRYPRNFIAPDGRIFGFDSSGKMYYVETTATGAITSAGQFAISGGSDSSAAMFSPGRILQYGGKGNQAIVIDINGASPVVTQTASMLRQRRLSVATILADGKVVATGGSSVWNQMTDVSYEAEIWNPQTGQWTVGASGVMPRLYHGNALLLPDATVLVFGGGAPSPTGVPGNLNSEIFYPPYLFTAESQLAQRPVIDSAPAVVDVGRTIEVRTTSQRPVGRVTLVKTGSATHGWNMDQRFVDLPFSAQGPQLAVQIPARASDVPPGMWMMFVIDDSGVPSVAKILRVNVAGALNVATQPVLDAPGEQSTVAGSATSLQLSAIDPNGDRLQFSASGLPAGLSIDAATGLVSGVPLETGSYNVLFAASDGVNGASVNVTWNVTAAAPLVLPVPQAPAPGPVGSIANFSASATGVDVMYRWEFGDGTPVTAFSSDPNISHAFAKPGIFYVTVTATDQRGIERRQTIIHNVHLPITALTPAMSSNLALEQRGVGSARLWVVNPDNDTVSVFDAATRAKLAEIGVGTAPRTVAIAPDGAVWVVNKASATISIVNAETLTVTRTIALPRASQPYGIVMANGSGTALITAEATGSLLMVNTASLLLTSEVAVGPNPRHLALTADGSTAYVSRFITRPLPGESTVNVKTSLDGQPVGGEVVVVSVPAMSVLRTIVLAHSDNPDFENQGRGFPNYLGAAAISPDGTHAFVPSKQDNLLRGGARDGLMLNFQNTVRAVSSRVDLARQVEDLPARIDHDNASVASAAAFDPLGVYLFVALETSREVAVIDAHNRNELMRVDVGRAPQGLLVSPDRRTLYVHNFMDRSVTVLDLSPLMQQGLADVHHVATLGTVSIEKLNATVLRGKQHFYDARDTRLARDRYMSCATCHSEGGHDGRVWDLTSQGEGLRNTISLRGRAGGQGMLHWSNNFDEVQDFEGQIRTLAGGSGLMTDAQFNTGTRSQPLGQSKFGLSSDLDALATYVVSLGAPDPSPYRLPSGALSALGVEGKAVYSNLNCAACHGGAAFSNSGYLNPVDIGTVKPSSGKRLGAVLSGIDIPTLRDVWSTSPYLHDGSAATLEAAVGAHAGIVLSDPDMNRLVTYLRELGSDEFPLAKGGGLLGSYFSGTALGGDPVLIRTEGVNFSWGTAAPASAVPVDLFSVRWTGSVTIPTSGSYRFRTVSNDGVRLWVNDQQRINVWTNHSSRTDTSITLNFVAGQRVPIRLEYYDQTGSAVIRLQWLAPGSTKYVAIPTASLNAN
jgi:YVTN family beta-propeller protein